LRNSASPAPRNESSARNPWAWIPTLYFAQGLPNVVVATISVVMFKGMGISNTDIALYTSWLYLPWVLKPLWSPVVDILKTRRQWIWAAQFFIGAGFAGVALTIPTSHFFQYSLAFMWLLAFSSATHDIAADGFYMLATTEREQAFFVGVRSTFFRLAMVSAQGLLVILAGIIQTKTGLPEVPFTIQAKPGAPTTESVLPVPFDQTTTQNATLRLLASATQIEIAPQPRPKTEIKTLLAEAGQWNATNGFTHLAEDARTQAAVKPSLWTRFVSEPLGRFLRRHFGQTHQASAGLNSGNIGVAYVRLGRDPQKEMVVAIAFARGDSSVSIVEGSRLTFGPANWNIPAVVVFQLDPKLNHASTARFSARTGSIRLSWVVVFIVLTCLFTLFAIYHRFILPRPARDLPGAASTAAGFIREFFRTFGAFFRKDRIGVLLLFLLFYRFAEAQLVKLVTPFLLDTREVGGLGLTTGQVGFAYGLIGVIALTCGGLLGGMLVSRNGLRSWIWPMVLIMHLPDAAFLYLASAQPANFAAINFCVALEQFGYGFGFTAYMLYMIYIARGQHATAHYAICTGFMALGIMLPGMFSGWLQDHIGYQHFFEWVMLSTIPGFFVTALVPLEPEFGKKS
jgi:PAT family beta-lactamase induction signal transducer AmpG